MHFFPSRVALPLGLIGQSLITFPWVLVGHIGTGFWLGCLWAFIFHLGVYALNRLEA